ncbi:hypothetical protein P280DRAFT_467030 [Massarina eburnea CBS 473.64]|uniref:N-acetyltransferase domain-containing protein n=1 Tax=Massarina eburnea CBS 473.64 TaxID=1395130 RepID=A0A6A6S9N0_9PLEO|nr:hypothetical protein P280DRAFT_467030 [Massarina eburnea CBS 473.64]
MPLETAIVTSPSELPEIGALDYVGWQTPYNPQLKHFRPSFSSREEAIKWYIIDRTTLLQEGNPKITFIKAIDTEIGMILGYALWEYNDLASEGSTGAIQALWHPEGSDEREFAERFVNGLWGFIGKRVTRPHMDLLGIVVHPDHRKRGAGRLLIRWGIDKADELGIETVVSSLQSAVGAYEKSGLGAIEVIPPDPSLKVESPSEKWKELQQDDLSGVLMWRPIGHDYVKGVDKAPWL